MIISVSSFDPAHSTKQVFECLFALVLSNYRVYSVASKAILDVENRIICGMMPHSPLLKSFAFFQNVEKQQTTHHPVGDFFHISLY